jgi:integrase
MGKPIRHYDKWRIRWTDENGKRRSRTFTDRKAAALALKRQELEVEERRRGLRAPELPDKTFSDAADYWEHHRAPLKRSYKDDLSMLKQLRPHFGKVPLADVGGMVIAIDRYKAKKTRLNKKTLNNHLTLLGSILRAAHDLGWMNRLPPLKKPRVRVASQDYSYLRTEDEIRRFLISAEAEGETAHMLYTTAIYTGMRAGELAALQWSDIDFDTRLITVQRSFDGPTKADDVRYVPILNVLLPVLRRWRLRHPGRLVFTNRDGRMLQPSGRIFQEVLHRVLDRAAFPKVERSGKLRRYIHFHSLRHTFASHWVMRGGDLFKLQKILGHKSIAMTQRYAHLRPSVYREDYGRLGASPAIGESHGESATVRSG